jgi:UDP-N-acetylglucosamine 2-epimerase (non-hydrolysing)
MTDSGGAQQEACILNVPCVTLRDTTEWVETVDIGANKVVGTDPDSICRGAREMLDLERMWRNPFGDGTSGEQVVEICCRFMNEPVRSLLAAETR